MAKLLALQLQSDHFHCFFDYKWPCGIRFA